MKWTFNHVTTHSHAIFEVSAYLRKYDAAVSSYRSAEMKTHSYLPCEEVFNHPS